MSNLKCKCFHIHVPPLIFFNWRLGDKQLLKCWGIVPTCIRMDKLSWGHSYPEALKLFNITSFWKWKGSQNIIDNYQGIIMDARCTLKTESGTSRRINIKKNSDPKICLWQPILQTSMDRCPMKMKSSSTDIKVYWLSQASAWWMISGVSKGHRSMLSSVLSLKFKKT